MTLIEFHSYAIQIGCQKNPIIFNHWISLQEFRDCFSLFAREKYITSKEQLAMIMRSLAFSPTLFEVEKFFNEHNKGNLK